MKDYLKGIRAQLHHTFDGVAGRPMSWQLIDALCKLDEAETARDAERSARRYPRDLNGQDGDDSGDGAEGSGDPQVAKDPATGHD